MNQLVWKDDYSVGNAILDNQHKKIIGLISKYILAKDTSESSETITEIISEMGDYAINHFKTEEEMLKSCNYPDYDEHKAEHVKYRRKIIDLCENVMGREGFEPDEIKRFLVYWWTSHILESDKKYEGYLSDNSV